MKLKYLVDRLNYKLGQYAFTKMYWPEDIIYELNWAREDVYTRAVIWDFMIKRFNNIQGLSPSTTPIPTASSYTLDDAEIFNVIDATYIKDNQKLPLIYRKYGQFSNWQDTTREVFEYTRNYNVITLSNPVDIEIVYEQWLKRYTVEDYNNNIDMVEPNDFAWFLQYLVMSNTTLIFLSDWVTLSREYANKAELSFKQIGSKYGKKYANPSLATATPWQWHSKFVRTQVGWSSTTEEF